LARALIGAIVLPVIACLPLAPGSLPWHLVQDGKSALAVWGAANRLRPRSGEGVKLLPAWVL